MEVQLKIGQVTKIISLIPKAFHATSLSLAKNSTLKPSNIMIYFSYGKADLENKNFADLPYVQFKPDQGKARTNYIPTYNSLDKAYDYCLIETDKPGAIDSEVVLHYEGI